MGENKGQSYDPTYIQPKIIIETSHLFKNITHFIMFIPQDLYHQQGEQSYTLCLLIYLQRLYLVYF